MPNTRAILHSAGDAEWFSPRWVCRLSRWVLRGIELDPASCAAANAVVGAERYFVGDPDEVYGGGLTKPWTARTLFVNCPYTIVKIDPATGKKRRHQLVSRFVDKLIDAQVQGDVREGSLALLNATTDRQWFMRLWSTNWVVFFYRRLRFWKPGRKANQPTHGNVLFYRGVDPSRFVRAFGSRGAVLPPLDSLYSGGYKNLIDDFRTVAKDPRMEWVRGQRPGSGSVLENFSLASSKRGDPDRRVRQGRIPTIGSHTKTSRKDPEEELSNRSSSRAGVSSFSKNPSTRSDSQERKERRQQSDESLVAYAKSEHFGQDQTRDDASRISALTVEVDGGRSSPDSSLDSTSRRPRRAVRSFEADNIGYSNEKDVGVVEIKEDDMTDTNDNGKSNGSDYSGSTPLQFTQFESTIKTMVKTDLTGLDIFFGHNKAGKSGALDAVRLAMTGKHPVGVHKKSLAKIAANGQSALRAVLSGNDLRAAYEIDDVGSKGKPPAAPTFSDRLRPLIGEHPIPTLSLADLITKGGSGQAGDAARAALFARFGGGAGKTLEPRALNDDQQALWDTTLAEAKAANPDADAALHLSALVKLCDSGQRSSSRLANAMEKESNEDDSAFAASGAEQISELETKLEEAVVAESRGEGVGPQLMRARSDRANLDKAALQWKDQIQTALANQESAKAAFADAEQRAAALRAEAQPVGGGGDLEGDYQRIKTAIEIAERCIAKNFTGCVFDPDSFHDYPKILPRLQALAEQRRLALEVSRQPDTTKNAEADEIERSARAGLNAANVAVASFENRRASLREQVRAADAVIKTLEGQDEDVGPEYTGPPAQEIREQLAALRSAQSVAAEIERKAAEERKHRSKAANYGTIKKEGKRLQKKVLGDTAKSAEEAVNRVLVLTGNPWVAKLEMTDTSCAWAIETGDGLLRTRHVMCGSEESVLALALAIAWSVDEKFRVVLVDDEYLARLEPLHLQGVLTMLQNLFDSGIVHHVFAAWPALRIDHVEEIPDGWNAINVGLCGPKGATA